MQTPQYIAKNEASNINKDFFEDIMTKLLREEKVINKKTSEGLNSFYSNIKNQEHYPSLNKRESQNEDQTRIEVPHQIKVNITRQQDESEIPISKIEIKAPNCPIPIINENIETPILKNTESNRPTLEIWNFQKLKLNYLSLKVT